MIERSEIQWGLTPIPFLVRRSDRRETVALTIDAGRLVVTAHPEVPLGRLNDVVRRKAPWVVQRIKKARESSPPPASTRKFETGETVLYRGRQLRLKVIEKPEEDFPRMWAGWYEIPIPPDLHGEARWREVRRRLAGSLKEHADLSLHGMLSDVCLRLRITAPAIVVREQSKRWGSCDAKGVVRINWRIIQAALPLIEYVLVHELVHLLEPTHNARFVALMDRFMPKWQSHRQVLNRLPVRHVAWVY